MDQQQQSRWWPTRTQVLWTTGIIAALALLISLFGGYFFGWKWTGLVKDADFPMRTLWDWMQLLIIPAAIAGAGIWFSQQQRERELQIADQRQRIDRVIATERRQDDALQAYLDHIGGLLLHKDKPLRQSKEGDEVRALARARTVTVLAMLDGYLRASVVVFLYESGLIAKDRVIVDLREAYLSEAVLRGDHLLKANLREVNLGDADLAFADLYEADLNNADLSHANLEGANLEGLT